MNNNDLQHKRYEEDLQRLPENGTITGWLSDHDFAIRRVGLGHLCGYVKVEGFKSINFEYGEIYIECHGGITFDGISEISGKKGRWIGFDCAHSEDWSPDFQHGEYRDTDFVLLEIKKIIEQLKGYYGKK